MLGQEEYKVEDAATPEEMRAEIFRLSHYDPIVREVTMQADYNGLSAEDRYTLLVYHLLRKNRILESMQLDFLRTRVASVVIPNKA